MANERVESSALDDPPLRTELQTTRLLLRPFEPSDVEDALAYRNDEEFARFLPHIPQPFSREHAEAFVALNMAEPWNRSPTFAVVLGDRLIGTVTFEIEAPKRMAMVGYAIGRRWWAQGITVEAVRAAMAWATATFGLTRIWAATDERNVRSIRVLEKLGMVREARCVAKHVGRDGQRVHELVYGMRVERPIRPCTRP
jgi:RimJ/RimL family protein N-acetyltransferase